MGRSAWRIRRRLEIGRYAIHELTADPESKIADHAEKHETHHLRRLHTGWKFAVSAGHEASMREMEFNNRFSMSDVPFPS